MAVLPMIIVVGLLSVLVIDRTTATLKDEVFARLESVRTVKANTIADYFAGRRSDMAALVETADTLRQGAFDQLLAVQTIKRGQVTDYLQTTFNMVRALKDNLSTAQAIAEFAQAIEAAGGTGGPQWTEVEKQFGFTFETARDDFGFYDLFLIAEDGRVVYSVIKELDLGANVLTGDLKDSGLGRAFRGALGQEVAVEDFAPFGDLPAAFVAGPVLDAGGELVGVLAVQLSTRGINAIMTERTGLGQSGETYLVGPDKLFRSDSRFVDESTVLNPAYVVDTLAVNEALSGNSGQEIVLDYRGVHVLSAYAPLEIAGLQWAILAEIDLAEAMAPRVEGAEKDFFTQYKESCGYYDLFLISPDGYVFYTVEHGPPDQHPDRPRQRFQPGSAGEADPTDQARGRGGRFCPPPGRSGGLFRRTGDARGRGGTDRGRANIAGPD
jgi:methyl-accepting chemotaxis protein